MQVKIFMQKECHPFSAVIECPTLSAPSNGQVSYTTDLSSPFDIGTVATFSCDAGFSLNGTTALLTCADDDQADTIGTWGGTEPSCLSKSFEDIQVKIFMQKECHPLSAVIECPTLTAPSNGQVSYPTDMSSPFEIGTVATFSCDAGFSLNGTTATLTCADDDQADTIGTWGGTEPSCLGKSLLSHMVLTRNG